MRCATRPVDDGDRDRGETVRIVSTRGGDTTRCEWVEGQPGPDAPEFSLIFRP
jgi:hypothetical protein